MNKLIVRMSNSNLLQRIQGFSVACVRNHINAYAAGSAFFIFLSLIPYLIILLTIIPYTTLTKSDVMIAVIKLLPDLVDPLAVNIIDELYEQSIAVLPISVIAVVWSSAKGFLSITRGLNAIYNINETRNYFFLRIRAAAYTIVLAIVMIASLILSGFGKMIHTFLLKFIVKVPTTFVVLVNFRTLFTGIILTILFIIIFKYIPNRKSKSYLHIPGAVFAGIGWTLFSWVFSIYINTYNGFSMYGSLTTIVIIMIWLYMCMYIMFIGAEINSYFEEYFEIVVERKRIKKMDINQKKDKRKNRLDNLG